ncbi:hypothetical protein M885DRAFT_485916 [Pelagophyceae sp. CCMP2097]|nr:hypothetical protein M885DRAFT_485916 [Pelagophyceae sp. CCMP2097]
MDAVRLHLGDAARAALAQRVVDAGGCHWCALRSTAPPWALYGVSDDELRLLWNCKHAALKSCTLCRGALNASSLATDFVSAAAGHAVAAADLEAANVCLTLPGALAVRHEAFFELAQTSGVSEAALRMMHSIKDALKHMLKAELSRRLAGSAPPSKAPSDEALWRGAIEFSVEYEALACDEFAALPGRYAPSQKKPKGHYHKRQRKNNDEASVDQTPVWNNRQVETALESMTNDERASMGRWLAKEVECPLALSATVKCTRESLWLAGRYRKLSRHMPQSPWYIDGVRKGISSVDEALTCAATPLCDCDAVKFQASGREDIDVRMLGRGRPFVVECVNPKRPPFPGDGFVESKALLDAFVAAVAAESSANGTPLEVLEATISDKAGGAAMQAGAEVKKKAYVAVVWSSSVITEADCLRLALMKNVNVDQLTPVRVMHTRSVANRVKVVHSLRLDKLNGHFATLHMQTSAGTYIKEFVHGDLGRTRPSLADLLGAEKADILQLDVADIEDDADNADNA